MRILWGCGGSDSLRVHSSKALGVLSGTTWKARTDSEFVPWPLREHCGTLGSTLTLCWWIHTPTHSFLRTFKIRSLSPSIQDIAGESTQSSCMRSFSTFFYTWIPLKSYITITTWPLERGKDGGSVSWGRCLLYHVCCLIPSGHKASMEHGSKWEFSWILGGERKKKFKQIKI